MKAAASKTAKMFADHLTLLETQYDRDWVLKGSEEMIRYLHHSNYKNPTMGIDTYGTKKIDGQTCVSIAIHQRDRAEKLGWRTVKLGIHYAYVLPKENP